MKPLVESGRHEFCTFGGVGSEREPCDICGRGHGAGCVMANLFNPRSQGDHVTPEQAAWARDYANALAAYQCTL